MATRRVPRKTERTPAETAALKAEREHFQAARPGVDDLLASGEYDGPFPHADVRELLSSLATLKAERDRLGLTLDEVSERSGIDKAALSRLENGKTLNPTVQTLWRYASALGMRIGMTAEPAGAV